MATAETGRGRAGQQHKSIEDMVSFAVSHRTRVQILIVLNQGTYCPAELADIIGVPVNRVSNHLKELAEGGSIEVAETKRRRNFFQNYYRAIEVPEHSQEDLLAMTPLERQMIASLNAQALIAEVMGSLVANKISEDPNHIFVWDRLNLDDQGRREVTAEQERHWERLAQIEEESLLRSARTKEESTPYVVAALGFVRGREVPFVRTSAFGE
jgi:DNA-binding transcriptional ArsR family regulator